jgi:hypothetical protein
MRRRHPQVRVEPPAWWRCFDVEAWRQPGDDEVRYAAGALIGADEVAKRRWYGARRAWAIEHDF